LDKTGKFPLLGRVKRAYRDAVFDEFTGFGEGFAAEGGSGLVFF
jgi:hypothetical protein